MNQPTGLYRFSSVARPVDPAYPTNRALLFALPIIAFGGAIAPVAGLGAAAPVPAALAAVLAALGSWALARELAPDDNAAAFASLVLGFGAQVALGPVTVLPLFVAIVLSRIVNRTPGLHPRPVEAALLAGFVAWAMLRLGDPGIGIAATLAFFLDASLARPARWQLIPGFACFVAALYVVLRDGMHLPALVDLGGAAFWIVVAILAGFFVLLVRTRDLRSVGDVSGESLDAARVRGGMFVTGVLAVTAPIYRGDESFNPLLVACMAGVVMSALLTGLRTAAARTGFP